MNDDDRLTTFINSFDKGYTPFLEELEKQALKDRVPIIRKDMQGLMRYLMIAHRPMSILEVGTATGFSALLMHTYAPKGCHITTIEKYEPRIPVARDNFKRAGAEDDITLIEGDAAEVLKNLDERFDFIFMDAAKGQYIHFLPDVLRLLKEGGTLVTDNVLKGGEILESKYIVTRRNRTIHNRMRDYIHELKNTPSLETVILNVGDGVTVSCKIQENEDEK